ncbi:exosortase-associated protein EpsI, B-type [Massilia sp. METH4]|uniref:exosortase-associated protein EpsI, B-type n=1 Tax=Massilia sp. METH4 TaxID=3123041 RepID=UPI0030D47584
MTRTLMTSLVLGALMLSAAATTRVVTPTAKMADNTVKFNLEQMIPSQFGQWQVDTTIVPLKLDPETEAKLNKLYNQTVTRTYVNQNGDRVMLSIAYGGDQSEGLGVHKPEVCYVAQGFDMRTNKPGQLNTQYGNLPVRRLMAVAGERHEPITYWLTIGNKIALSGLDSRLTMLRYGLGGVIPDGMLVRVSAIDRDAEHSYRVQDRFVQDMLTAVSPEARNRLIGVF